MLILSMGITAQELTGESEKQVKNMVIPTTIDFQGRLHDGAGNPVNAALSITFSLYTMASGGTAQWTEVRTVQVVDGLFQVKLGEVTPFNDTHFNDPDRWLGIKVGSEAEMSPRTRFSSVGYAMQSIEWDPTWWEGGNPNSDIGRAGRVGIGTGDPEQTLDVAGTIRLRGHLFDYNNTSGTTGQVLRRGANGLLWQNMPVSQWTTAGSNIYYNNGNTGIGTSTPTALLHTNGTGSGQGNVVFVGEEKFSNPGPPSVSGGGTRMMWYPDKAAFRAGYVEDNQWDEENVGWNSFAVGSSTTASGHHSNAMGYSSTASGDYSTAIGYESVAAGNNSTAIGLNVVAQAYGSFIIGRKNIIRGDIYNWVPTDPLFVVGNGDFYGIDAFTILKNGKVGIYEPFPRKDLSIGSYLDLYSGTGSITAPTIRGNSDHLFISSYNAGGLYFNRDGGSGETRFFNGTPDFEIMRITSNGRVGIRTATPRQQLSVGDYLDLYSGYANAPSRPSIRASINNNLIINAYDTGILYFNFDGGTGETRFYSGTTELFRISANGNVGIGKTDPAYKLDVNGSIRVNSTVYSSDRRLKTQIQSIQYGLNTLMDLQGVSYLWNSQEFPQWDFDEGIQLGFIAQELEQVIPELVSTDEEGFKSIDYVKVIPILVEGMKELKAENDELNTRLERLEKTLEKLMIND